VLRVIASATFVLLSPLQFAPLILLFQAEISFSLFLLALALYMPVMWSLDFVIAFLIPPSSDFVAGWLLGIGILGIGISFVGIMTWGWITIWPTSALIALAVSSIAKNSMARETGHVRRRRVTQSI